MPLLRDVARRLDGVLLRRLLCGAAKLIARASSRFPWSQGTRDDNDSDGTFSGSTATTMTGALQGADAGAKRRASDATTRDEGASPSSVRSLGGVGRSIDTEDGGTM